MTDELNDLARQGVSFRLVARQADGTPVYKPQRGSAHCVRCQQMPENLYGTMDAPLCSKCIGEIIGEWCAKHVAEQRRLLGLDDAPAVEDKAQ